MQRNSSEARIAPTTSGALHRPKLAIGIILTSAVLAATPQLTAGVNVSPSVSTSLEMHGDYISTGVSNNGTLGAALGRDLAVLGSGYNVYLDDRMSLFADYNVLVNNTQLAHVGSGGLQFQW